MINRSARFPTGHFFLTMMALMMVEALTGCESKSVPLETELAPETGDISVVVCFSNGERDNSIPKAMAELPSTAAGQFLPPVGEKLDFFYSAISEADNAGKLLILVLPEGRSFTGSRDHLIVQIDSNGLPVAVIPDIVPEMLEDSLWDNPVVRQQTILQLISFLKPDMIFQVIPEAGSSLGVIKFWQEHAEQNNITVSLYSPPITENHYRGWGAFTGRGIENQTLKGMDMRGFAATVRLISGLEWNIPNGGYPAMQAFYLMEL